MRINLLLLCVLIAGTAWAGPFEKYYQNLPVQLSEPILPSIPDNQVILTDFAGVGDGITDNTQAFEKAVSALSKKGGGHLVVPAGIFLTGPITLKDHIDLHLEKNALILLDPDKQAHLRKGKVVPGITNDPQPTAHPNDNAQTANGDRYFFCSVSSTFSMLGIITSSVIGCTGIVLGTDEAFICSLNISFSLVCS